MGLSKLINMIIMCMTFCLKYYCFKNFLFSRYKEHFLLHYDLYQFIKLYL